MTIIGKILNNMDKLSNKQKKIAGYLIRNSEVIGFMSLKELSKEINVSEVTILNFCKSIGIDSFTELKKLFQELTKEKLVVPTKMKSSLSEIESLDDAYNNTINLLKFNQKRTIEDNDINVLKEISHILSKSRRVYICGQGMSRVIAECLKSRLKLINIDSRIIELGDGILSSIELLQADKKDSFILISFPEYAPKVVNLAKYLEYNNYSLICITDSEKSPLAKYSKYALKCYSDSLGVPNFISSAIWIIEVLIVMICFMLKEDLISHLDNLEKLSSSLMEHDI